MQTQLKNRNQACQSDPRQSVYQQFVHTFLLSLLLLCIPVGRALAQDFTNTGALHLNDGTTLHVAGTLTNNSNATATNDGNIEVGGTFDFQNGEIDEPNSGIVIFLDNATAINASHTSHVDSLVRKIGDDAFIFPTGDGGQYGPLSISAPAAVSDQVDVSYWLSNPQTDAGPTLDTGLTGVSSVEYWNVSSASTVDLTLHWDADSDIANLITGDLADLRVVGWDNTKWVDLGNSGTTGDTTNGSVTANGITPNTYSAYTIGSVAAKAQLQVEITIDPAGPLGVNDIFTVTVTVTNPGTSDVSPVPIEIAYNNNALTFFPEELTVPPDDLDDDGTLTWSDITQVLGALTPGVPESMVIRFTALQDTTSTPATPPCNVAGVSCLAVSIPETSTLAPITDTTTVDVELGLLNKYTLGDFVWQDDNGDGIKDTGEAGINGVLVNLYLDGSDGSNPDGVPAPGEFLVSTTTSNSPTSPESISQDGYYTFSVVTGPGKIYIVEIDANNFTGGQPLEGATYTGNNGGQPHSGAHPRVVPMTTVGDTHINADFAFEPTPPNSAPIITTTQTFSIAAWAANGTVLNGISDPGNGVVDASDPDSDPLQNWQITGDSSNNGGGGVFAIDANGELTVADSANLLPGIWTLTLTVDDNQGNTSVAETVTIFVPVTTPSCAAGETPVFGYADVRDNNGAANPDNALSSPDGTFALLAGGDNIELDLSDTIPAGETIYVILAKANTNGNADIGSSLVDSGYGDLITFNSGNVGEFQTIQYTAPADGARWLRVRRQAGQVRLDAVAYSYCQAVPSANVDLDVTVNTVGPVRQTDPVSYTVTITNVDSSPLSSLPVDVVFPDAYLDCTTASQTPDNAVDNQMSWNDLLGTAGVTLNQNQAISFEVNCTAGLDTTLLPNQQAVLTGMAANASDSDGISIFAPTSVMMSQRKVQVDRSTGQVTISWQTTDESQMTAFNVYRKWADEVDWTLLNSTPLSAERTSESAGGQYTFTDQLQEEVVAASGLGGYRDAHYRLGLLMVDGSEQFLDLGSTESASQQRDEIFLPLVAK
ncbi:MAG: SdrD B-like domain-containing protein [Chloroflexota bacterium]